MSSLTAYEMALNSAVTLMIFIGVIMIFGPVPYVKERSRYVVSRKCMGIAILILALNYGVHLFINPRFSGHEKWAIAMDLSTFVLVVPFFYSALMELMAKDFNFKFNRKKATYSALVIGYGPVLSLMMTYFPEKQNSILIVGASIYCVYASAMGLKLFERYRRLLRLIDETQSEDMEPYVRWMSFITFYIIIYGPLCGACAFLSNNFTYLWVLSSIPMYIYIFFSYKNYLLFDDRVAEVELETDDIIVDEPSDTAIVSEYYREKDLFMTRQIEVWIKNLGYTKQGITLTSLASTLCTNRTYLGGYMKRTQNKPFREWINDMRIDYAKKLMSSNPFITIAEVAEMCGYSTSSHFTTTFTRYAGLPPSKWIRTKEGTHKQ